MPSKWFFVAALVLIAACKTKQAAVVGSGKDIVFGEGGGFTGAVQTWVLRSNGNIDSAVQDSLVFTGRSIPPSEAANLMQEVELLLSKNIKTEPGNYYYFMNILEEFSPVNSFFVQSDSAHFLVYNKLRTRCTRR